MDMRKHELLKCPGVCDRKLPWKRGRTKKNKVQGRIARRRERRLFQKEIDDGTYARQSGEDRS